MSFDAGSIKSKLELDTSAHKQGFEDAADDAHKAEGKISDSMEKIHHSIRKSFEEGFEEAKKAAKESLEKIHEAAKESMAKVGEAFNAVSEVMSEAFGPVIGELTEKLQSVSSALDEGLIIGGIAAIGVALGAVSESVEIVSAKFHQMGLAAETAGVSTQFLARLTAVGGTVGLSLEQLGTGFKLLEQRAEMAAEGTKEAVDAFHRLGISAHEAQMLAQDPEKLFDRVSRSLGEMKNSSERTNAALGLLGRQGAALAPLFLMSREEFNKTADAMDRMGGVVTQRQVEMGESFGKLEGYVGAAMQGIEAALAKPVLEYFEDHLNEIEPKIEAFTTAIRSGITTAFEGLSEAGKKVVPVLNAIADAAGLGDLFGKSAADISKVDPELLDIAKTIGHDLKDAFDNAKPAAEGLWAVLNKFSTLTLKAFGSELHGVVGLMDQLLKMIAKIEKQTADSDAIRGLDDIGDATGGTDPNKRTGNPYNLADGDTTDRYLAYQATDLGPTRGLTNAQAQSRMIQDATDDSQKREAQIRRDDLVVGRHWAPVTIPTYGPHVPPPSTVPTPPPSHVSPPLDPQQLAASIDIAVQSTLNSSQQITDLLPKNSQAIPPIAGAANAENRVQQIGVDPRTVAIAPQTQPVLPSWSALDAPQTNAQAARPSWSALDAPQAPHSTRSRQEHSAAGSDQMDSVDRLFGQLSISMQASVDVLPRFNQAITLSATAFEDVNRRIDSLLSNVTTGKGSSGGGDHASPGSTSGPVNQYITINPQFDTRDAVTQLAAKLMPEFRKLKSQTDAQFAGAGATAMMQASLGGGR